MRPWVGEGAVNWISKSGLGKRGPNMSSHPALDAKFSTTRGQWSSFDESSLSIISTISNKCGARSGRSAQLMSGTGTFGGGLLLNSCDTDLMCFSLLQAKMMQFRDKHA